MGAPVPARGEEVVGNRKAVDSQDIGDMHPSIAAGAVVAVVCSFPNQIDPYSGPGVPSQILAVGAGPGLEEDMGTEGKDMDKGNLAVAGVAAAVQVHS